MATESLHEEGQEPDAAGACRDHVEHDWKSIFHNWRFLAAIAWRGFETYGCGAVVVSVGAECADVAYAAGAVPASYAHLVARYNPREQIVVRHGADQHAYVVDGRPSPRECSAAESLRLMDTGVHCVPRSGVPQ
jgi:hypothetical protein